MDNDRLRTESQTLAVNLKDRARKHQQTQELYDRLKHKQMTAVTQFAAQSAANDSIEEITWNGAHSTTHNQRTLNDRATEHVNSEFHRPVQRSHNELQGPGGMMPPPALSRQGPQGNADCPGVPISELTAAAGFEQTPHRTRLGQSAAPGSTRLRNVSNNIQPSSQPTPRQRQPLKRISPNGSAINGYGMRAGLKIGGQNGKLAAK